MACRRRSHISAAWLGELYSLVKALMDSTPSRQQLEQLEDMRATLCTSIDGF